MRLHFFFLFAFTATLVNASDLTVEQLNQVMDNVSHEYTTCAAYFQVVSEVMRNAGNEDVSGQYVDASTAALKLAITAAKAGRSDEMAVRVVQARSDNEIKQMLSEIEYDAANVSLLSSKHGQLCKSAMEDVQAVIDEWSRKIEDQQ